MRTGGKSPRPAFDPFPMTDRRAVAYREAAQAIVVTVLGYKVRHVALSWQPGGDTAFQSMNTAQWKSAAISWAVGLAALARLKLLDEHPCGDEAWRMYGSFWEMEAPPILETIKHIPAEAQEFEWKLMQHAVKFVEVYWDQIDRLAQLLMRKGKVSGKEIRTLLGDRLVKRIH